MTRRVRTYDNGHPYVLGRVSERLHYDMWTPRIFGTSTTASELVGAVNAAVVSGWLFRNITSTCLAVLVHRTLR